MSGADWTQLVQIAVPVATAILGTVAFVRGPGSRRSGVKQLADLLAVLPAENPARKDLEELVSDQVRRLVYDERNTSGWTVWVQVGISLVLAPAVGFLAVLAAQQGTWWGYVLGFFLALTTLYLLLIAPLSARNRANWRQINLDGSWDAEPDETQPG